MLIPRFGNKISDTQLLNARKVFFFNSLIQDDGKCTRNYSFFITYSIYPQKTCY